MAYAIFQQSNSQPASNFYRHRIIVISSVKQKAAPFSSPQSIEFFLHLSFSVVVVMAIIQDTFTTSSLSSIPYPLYPDFPHPLSLTPNLPLSSPCHLSPTSHSFPSPSCIQGRSYLAWPLALSCASYLCHSVMKKFQMPTPYPLALPNQNVASLALCSTPLL